MARYRRHSDAFSRRYRRADHGAFVAETTASALENLHITSGKLIRYALDDVALTLIPGEIFPELVTGSAYGFANPQGINPRPLRETAQEYGVKDLLIVGLANDELGYIVPPSDFLVNEEAPYLKRQEDSLGEDHYEETNSVGPACAPAIAAAFEAALQALQVP